MKKIFQLFITINSVLSSASAQQTSINYLSGTDKDHTVQWDFMVTKGQNRSKWSKIAVPSNWELQGFGTYNYYKDENNPNEKGLYKYHFKKVLYLLRYLQTQMQMLCI